MAPTSFSSILSNSSMQQTPLSAKIKAPASIANSPVSGSLYILAVNPAAVLPFPLVYIARGMYFYTNYKNKDFPVAGSPTMQMLMSPLNFNPSFVFLFTPPTNINSIPFFIYRLPKTVGAIKEDNLSRRFLFFSIYFISYCYDKGSEFTLSSKVSY